MVIERLFKPESRAHFMREHFLKLPYSMPHGADAFRELGSWDVIESLFRHPEPDVLIVKQGRRWEGSSVPPFAEAQRLFRDGHTLLVRHAEKLDPRFAELAAGFERDFAGPVDVHIYCTPASEFGFGWHYDAEDVFILQTDGSKEYLLRKNTVNPWPLAETLPRDMQYGREIMPLMNCLLAAGDWLYLPNGYWHMANAKEDSISIAVGVMTPSALDAFDFLRTRLLDDLRWRQRLPCPGDAAAMGADELVERYRELFTDLGEDLARAFRDESLIRAFLASRQAKIKSR